ncbi:transporter substrate-binding domain-containing protein [Vibrio profundum]|uniref:substrate-binding periplasmic protein n=1 Tax=Vibrio profundum TaxID=2910247 RepID=UPI003D112E57
MSDKIMIKGPVRRVFQTLIFMVTVPIAVFYCIKAYPQTINISTMAFAPAGYLGEDRKPMGMAYEMANGIATNAGLDFTNSLKPYPRVLLDLESGDADIALLYINNHLEKSTVKVASIFTDSNIIIGKAGLDITSLEDLYGLKVGILRKASYSKSFDSNTNITKVRVKNYRQSIRMLLKGRIDALIGGTIIVNYELRKLGHDQDVLGTPFVISRTPVWLLVSKKNKDRTLKEKLRNSVISLKKIGFFTKTAQKYIGKTSSLIFDDSHSHGR